MPNEKLLKHYRKENDSSKAPRILKRSTLYNVIAREKFMHVLFGINLSFFCVIIRHWTLKLNTEALASKSLDLYDKFDAD